MANKYQSKVGLKLAFTCTLSLTMAVAGPPVATALVATMDNSSQLLFL